MLARGLIPEHLVWTGVSVLGLPVLEGRQVQVTVVALPELAADGAIESFDATIELG